MLLITVVVLSLTAICIQAKPVIKFDQRQDSTGDNIRVDLSNLLFLAVIPKKGFEDAGSLVINLLARDAQRKRQGASDLKNNFYEREEVGIEDRVDVNTVDAFIEPKTPYKVDISEAAKKIPRTPAVGKSTPATSSSDEDLPVPVVIPVENDHYMLRHKRTETTVASNTQEANVKEEQIPAEPKLIGSSIDQCGPERKRDKNGICQFIKENTKSH